MNTLSIQEINDKTLSKGVSSPNAVYEATQDTIAIDDMDNDPSTPGAYIVPIAKGSTFIVLGCGTKHIQGSRKESECTSAVNIRGELMWIPNRHIKHIANPILMDIRDLKNQTIGIPISLDKTS